MAFCSTMDCIINSWRPDNKESAQRSEIIKGSFVDVAVILDLQMQHFSVTAAIEEMFCFLSLIMSGR